MSSSIDAGALTSLVAAHGLTAALGTPAGLESASARLAAFFDSYLQHRRRHGEGSSLRFTQAEIAEMLSAARPSVNRELKNLPAEQDWAALLLQSQSNPHRVQALLQALAFVCSPEMLAMLWMVQLGASVKALHVDHERENVTSLTVLLDLPGAAEATEEFKSKEHWDLALLQFAALTKFDEKPVVSGFVALNFRSA